METKPTYFLMISSVKMHWDRDNNGIVARIRGKPQGSPAVARSVKSVWFSYVSLMLRQRRAHVALETNPLEAELTFSFPKEHHLTRSLISSINLTYVAA
jgi:hypothetical protein